MSHVNEHEETASDFNRPKPQRITVEAWEGPAAYGGTDCLDAIAAQMDRQQAETIVDAFAAGLLQGDRLERGL